MNKTIKELGGALWQGVRTALLMRPRTEALDVGLPAAAAMCALGLLASAAFDLTAVNGAGSFDASGLTREIAGYAVLLALLAWLPFRWAGAQPRHLFIGVIALSATVSFVIAPARFAVRRLAGSASALDPAVLAWLGFTVSTAAVVWVLLAAMRLGFGLAWRQRLLAGLGLAGATVVAGFMLPQAPMFPGQDDDERTEFSIVQSVANVLKPLRTERRAAPPPRIDVEAAMYRQPELLAEALRQIKPPRDDRPEIYYVGMAPFADQDVFIREAAAVKMLFDSRFGTDGRSVALINHRDSVRTVPLASITNLDRTLKHIGQLMRPDKDVLFLFLTSHGTEGLVSVQFPRFALNEITPAGLAKSLDAAGIKNRVLVISACHSGSFIPALANDNTLILTAARADRTSFGCSNENEWTYFGDAYFNHALRQQTSFIEAFDAAKTLIAGWEAKQKVTPSEPQISIGSAIRSTLAMFRFDGASSSASPSPSAAASPPQPDR